MAEPYDPNDLSGLGLGGDDTGQTLREAHPGRYRDDNQYADIPGGADDETILKAAEQEEARLREEDTYEQRRAQRIQDQIDAEGRARANRVGPVGPTPINRIPKDSFTPGNPWAGISDQAALPWEETHGALQSGSGSRSGGSVLDIISRIRGSQPLDTEPVLPGDLRGEPLSGRFTPPKTTAPMTASESFKNAKGFGDISSGEAKYYLPFNNPELGGKQRAVSNALKSIGFDTSISNPYTDYLASEGSRMTDQAALYQGLQGIAPDERSIASDVIGALGQGKTRIMTPEYLRAQLSTLKGRNRDELTPTQQSLMEAFETDPEFALNSIESISNLDPKIARYYKQAQAKRYSRFLDEAPSNTNRGLFDWIQGAF